jgi:hypothetical protein
MKPITLLISTALTGALLAAVPAQAAKIKLRPVAVKVAPKIQAPSPKIRMKLKAPTPKVVVNAPARVRVKVKAPDVAPRIKPDVKIATPTVRPAVPAIKVAPQVKPRIAVDVAPKIAAPAVAPRVKPAATISRLEPKRVPVPSVAPHAGDSGGPLNRPDFVDAGEAAQAASAAQAAREAADLGAIRDAATPELGLDTPDFAGGKFRTNRDILGAPEAERGGWMGGPSLGGAGVPELGNSHGKDTPANPWAVTPGSIASAAGGVAGQRGGGTVTLPVYNPKHVDHSRDFSVSTGQGDGTGQPYSQAITVHTKTRPDGTSTTTSEIFQDADGDGYRERHNQRVQEHDAEGTETEDSIRTDIGAKYDPEYAGGGGCQSMDCILNGGEGPTLKGQLENSPNQVLPAAPDEATETGRASASPAVAQDDLLSLYDPEGDGRGDRTRLEALCMHSEC